MESTTGSSEPDLTDLNNERTLLLVPVMVCLSFLIMLGIIGNAITIYNYAFKMPLSNHRCFVLWLASLDLCGCVVFIPYELIHSMHRLTFYEEHVCRIAAFGATLTSCWSALILCIIAVDRYFKICRSNKKQIIATTKVASMACCLSVIVSVFTSWPSALIWGYATVHVGVRNITGVDCYTSDVYRYTIYPTLYDSLHSVLFVMTSVCVTVLYTLVARQLRSKAIGNNSIHICEGSVKTSFVITSRCEVFKVSRQQQKRKNRAKQVTLVMFLITLTFVLSLLPHLILRMISNILPNFVEDLNPPSFILYHMFFLSYFVNHVSNPVLYFMFDSKFKRKCKEMLCIRCCYQVKNGSTPGYLTSPKESRTLLPGGSGITDTSKD